MQRFVAAVTLLMLVVASQQVSAQGFRNPRGGPGGGEAGQGQGGNQSAPTATLPNDPKLLQLHQNFVLAAEKLADEYIRGNQMDKARDCLTEILRLVPTYAPAASKLEEIHAKELTAQRKVMDVMANQAWQDTGLDVVEGKPFAIMASGQWTFRVSYNMDANGIPIPEELRDFNLGSLVAVIATPEDIKAASSGQGRVRPARDGDQEEQPGFKPFFVGASVDMVAPKSGRLYLRMYDGDPSDNVGKVTVNISGTFAGR